MEQEGGEQGGFGNLGIFQQQMSARGTMTEPGRPQSPQQNTRAGEFQQAWQGEFQQPQYWQEPPMNQMGERNTVESARRSYSRIGASFSVMIVVWMALVFVLGIGISMLHREAAHWMWVSLLVSDCSLYLVAVPLAYLMLKSVPEEPTRKFGMTFGELFEWFLVSLAIVFVGGLLGSALAALFSGGMAQNRLDNIVGGIPAWLNILAVVVVGPIVEEWLCRKQIIARVRRYGERLAIVVSALIFALFHLNLYQFFYAFGLGLVLGYIYMRTSQLKYTIGLHMAINFLGSVAGPFFSDWSDAHSAALESGEATGSALIMGVAAMLYILLYLVAVVAGVVLLIMECRRLEFYVTPAQLPKGTACSCAFVNAGMGVFITLTVFGMVLALMNVM